jgi:hypothetical protein
MSVIAVLCEAGYVVAPELPRGCHFSRITVSVIDAGEAAE